MNMVADSEYADIFYEQHLSNVSNEICRNLLPWELELWHDADRSCKVRSDRQWFSMRVPVSDTVACIQPSTDDSVPTECNHITFSGEICNGRRYLSRVDRTWRTFADFTG